MDSTTLVRRRRLPPLAVDATLLKQRRPISWRTTILWERAATYVMLPARSSKSAQHMLNNCSGMLWPRPDPVRYCAKGRLPIAPFAPGGDEEAGYMSA